MKLRKDKEVENRFWFGSHLGGYFDLPYYILKIKGNMVITAGGVYKVKSDKSGVAVKMVDL